MLYETKHFVSSVSTYMSKAKSVNDLRVISTSIRVSEGEARDIQSGSQDHLRQDRSLISFTSPKFVLQNY